MAISGAFLISFLCFFLLNTIYLAYEICLQSFAMLHSAVVKLYSKEQIFALISVIFDYMGCCGEVYATCYRIYVHGHVTKRSFPPVPSTPSL